MQQGNPIVIKELIFENSFILGRDLPKLGQKFIKKHIEKIYIDIVVAGMFPPAPGMGIPPGLSNISSLKTFLSEHPGTADSLKDLQIGKKPALKKYDVFPLNTSCFWGSTGSNITLFVQFHLIFVT